MKAFISSTQVSGVTAADVSVGGVLTMSGQMHWQIMLGPANASLSIKILSWRWSRRSKSERTQR